MANLVETAEWVDGIYQLETTDLVEGGPDGVDNIQAIQLAKRTQFLKALILAAQDSLAVHEAAADPHPQYLTTAEGNSLIATAVSALVNSSPTTLDTLNELAAALGNDPNFATTIATSLGNKQPIDQTLTALAALATAANKLIYATGADTFSTTDFTAFARTLLDDADAATMRATLGIQNLDFTASLSSNGYQKLPSGFIIQWGSINCSSSADTYVTFPLTFPTSCLAVVANSATNQSQIGNFSANATATGFTANVWYYNGSTNIRNGILQKWISIGY